MSDMKKYFLFILPSVLLSACCQQPGYECVNSSSADVTDKMFVLTRAEVEKYTAVDDSGFIRVTSASGNLLASQMDDLDSDGRWDELAFVIDLKGNEKQDFEKQ